MGRRLRTHWKPIVLAMVIMIVISTVGIHFLITRVFHDDPRQLPPPPDLGALPSRAWTLDAAQLTGNPNDVLLSLPQTLESYYGYGTVLSAPSTLVGAVGRIEATDSSEGQAISDITLIGIDLLDGSTIWKRPVGPVSQCSDHLDDGVITCWNSSHVVFVDTENGDLLSNTFPDFEVGRSEVVEGKAFISGIRHNGDKQNMILTGGTPERPASALQHTFRVPGPISSVDRVLPSENLFVTSTQTGGTPIYESTVYDLDSGTPTFTVSNDSFNVVGDGLFLITRGTEGGSVGTQELLARDGSPIVTAAVSANTNTSWPTATSEPPPIFLGDGAYDPATGTERWRDPRLLSLPGDPLTTVRALAARTVVVASAEKQQLIGLDTQTGQELWVTPWTGAYWIYDGLTDGDYYVFSDYTGMHSLQVADGSIAWSIPLPPGADPRHATVSSAHGDILLTFGSDISLWR